MLHMNTQHNAVPRAAYSLDEVARSLGISRRTLYQRMGDGTLCTVKFGKRRLVPATELERLLQPQQAAA